MLSRIRSAKQRSSDPVCYDQDVRKGISIRTSLSRRPYSVGSELIVSGGDGGPEGTGKAASPVMTR